MDKTNQAESFDEYNKILSYFDSIGIKVGCLVCHNSSMVPFDEPEEKSQEVEYFISNEKTRRRLPAFILLCTKCGFMRKHAKVAIEFAMDEQEKDPATDGLAHE